MSEYQRDRRRRGKGNERNEGGVRYYEDMIVEASIS